MDEVIQESLNECMNKINPHLLVDEDFKDDPSSLYQIAIEIKETSPTDKCLIIAYQYFEIAYQKGHFQSGVEMSEMLIKGEGIIKDPYKGQRILESLAKMKSAQAHYQLAYLAYYGFLKRDPKFIKRHLDKAIKFGHHDASDLAAEFKGLLKAKDYLFEKDYQEFKRKVQSRILLPEVFFTKMTSKKESIEYLLHLDDALNHDLKSIEILHHLHKDSQEAQQYWFHRYLDAHPDFNSMNKTIQTHDLSPTTTLTPHALNLEQVEVKNFQPHPDFPSKIPLLMQSHLFIHQKAYQTLKNGLAHRFRDKSIYLSHSLLAKAVVRKLLYHVSKMYDLKTKSIENHPTELIHELFRYVIHTIRLYHGDLTIRSGEASYFLTLLNQGDTFDRVPSMAKTLHYFNHQLTLSRSMIEAYEHLPWTPSFKEDKEPLLFSYLDQWGSDVSLQKDVKAILLCIVGLHISLHQAAFEIDPPIDKKADIYIQFYQILYTFLSRFYGIFTKENLIQLTEKFWHNDLKNGFIQKNQLALLFENYEKHFDTYEEQPFFFFESHDFKEDEEDEIILLT